VSFDLQGMKRDTGTAIFWSLQKVKMAAGYPLRYRKQKFVDRTPIGFIFDHVPMCSEKSLYGCILEDCRVLFWLKNVIQSEIKYIRLR